MVPRGGRSAHGGVSGSPGGRARMTFVELLRAMLDRRLFDCRLTPDRALGTLAEAETFLRDRGLLTRTADGALRSAGQ